MKVAILLLLICVTGTAQDRLLQWVERLAKYESLNNSLLKRLDKNGRYSYGCLQFQQVTFVSQVKRYGLVHTNASDAEIMERIYDCELQKATAVCMIRDNWRNYVHWWNVVKLIGRPPKYGK